MPRPLRSFQPGSFYHLTTRGNDGAPIVLDDADRRLLLGFLRRGVRRYRIVTHAWCLMTNHYHLVVETPTGEISRAMHFANGVYARRFNERHGRTGHVFGRRFHATEILTVEHLEAACAYVADNARRAYLVTRFEDWPWGGLGEVVLPAP